MGDMEMGEMRELDSTGICRFVRVGFRETATAVLF